MKIEKDDKIKNPEKVIRLLIFIILFLSLLAMAILWYKTSLPTFF